MRRVEWGIVGVWLSQTVDYGLQITDWRCEALAGGSKCEYADRKLDVCGKVRPYT